jgi:hypothetical protein
VCTNFSDREKFVVLPCIVLSFSSVGCRRCDGHIWNKAAHIFTNPEELMQVSIIFGSE